MKKLILILFLFAGLNCFGQKGKRSASFENKYHDEFEKDKITWDSIARRVGVDLDRWHLSPGEISSFDSLVYKFELDTQVIKISNDITRIKDLLTSVQISLDPYIRQNPHEYLRPLNLSIINFNENWAGKEIKGIKIPYLKKYKLMLITE